MTFRIPKHHLTDTRLVFFGQAGAGIISLVATIVTARYCGPTVFAFCMLTVLVLSVGLDVIDFGACSWSSRELAAGRISVSNYLHIMHRKSSHNLIYVFVGPLVYFLFPQSGWAILIVGTYPILWVRTNYIQQFLMVKGQTALAVRFHIMERLTWLLVLPMQYLNFDKWVTYILPIIFGLIVHNFLGKRALIKYSAHLSMTSESICGLTRKSKHIGLTGVITDVSNLDTLIVARFASINDSASYGLSQRFRGPLMLGFNSFGTRLRLIAASRDTESIRSLFKQEISFLIVNYLGLILASFFLYLLGEDIFGSKFPSINVLLAIGVLTTIPFSIIAIASNFLVATGFERVASRIFMSSVPFTLISVGISSHYQGVFFSLLALLLANLVTASISLFLSMRIWKKL